jgi:hypothetical protein
MFESTFRDFIDKSVVLQQDVLVCEELIGFDTFDNIHVPRAFMEAIGEANEFKFFAFLILRLALHRSRGFGNVFTSVVDT